MAPTSAYRKKTCTKCFKHLKVYLRCFKCDAVYHAKCLLKVPGFQADQKGHAFCCRNVSFKSDRAEEILASQENLTLVKWEEKYDSDKEFGYKEHLERHYTECPYIIQGGLIQETNKDKADLVCSFCAENFQKESYEQHIKQCEKDHILAKCSNPEGGYKCSRCKYSSYVKANLLNHMRTHTNERPFKCDMCDYAAIRKKTLNSHTLAKHSNAEKRYKCNDCKYSTYDKGLLVTHTRIHTNERPFKCEKCDYAAVQSVHLQTHILAKHSNAGKMYKCADCKFSSYIKGNLVRHMRIHTNERPFKCDMCDHTATQKGYLNSHILAKHSNSKKSFKCNDCEYSAYAKGDLSRHTRIHTNERPFKCDKCDYAAVQSIHLNVHILAKHSNAEKRYKCDDCNYSTYLRHSLVRHARIHSNERPFKCGMCDHTTTQRWCLKSHVLAKHSNAEKVHNNERSR